MPRNKLTIHQFYDLLRKQVEWYTHFLSVTPSDHPRWQTNYDIRLDLVAQLNDVRHQLPCQCGSGKPYHECGDTQTCG